MVVFLPGRVLLLFGTLLSAAVHALDFRCADFSSLPVVEAAGVTYSDAGVTEKFETILANHGATMARIRVWTAGDYNLTVALATAKRAYAVGMELYIDLHLSDTCEPVKLWDIGCLLITTIGADPGDQAIPSSWPTTLAGLNTEIYKYVFSSY